MKNKALLFSISLLIGIITISSFSFKKKKGDFVYIPSGSYKLEFKDFYSYDSETKYAHIDSFWILDHEVTNKEYKVFLSELKEKDMKDEFAICSVRNYNWYNKLETNEKYIKYYHTHEAYAEFPVVNISHRAAELYCEWLNKNNKDERFIFRLPTKFEWHWAASGGLKYGNYSWSGYNLIDNKGFHRCNYCSVGSERITRDTSGQLQITQYEYFSQHFKSPKERGIDIIAPSISYKANNFGLYNCCGNVAEMIDVDSIAMGGSWDSPGYDVRTWSESVYHDACRNVGFRPVKAYRTMGIKE